MPIWFLIHTWIHAFRFRLMSDVLYVCGHEFQYMISILALVYGLRNIFLFLLTCTMLSYGLVCSWRSYSHVNIVQLLCPDHVSHPCPYDSSEDV